MRLKMLLGDHAVTRALKQGEIRAADIEFEFAPGKLVQEGFKRVVRDLEFDVAELALVTFLLAKAAGKPLKLVPAVLVARYQHPFLYYNPERGPLKPEELSGRRIGLRSYSVTTATWVRGILADDYGVDLDSVKWTTFEEPHVAEFQDPPNLQKAPPGKDMVSMLVAGELDAAVLGSPPKDARLQRLIPDPDAAAKAWQEKHNGAIQINHMVVAKKTFSRTEDVYRALAESKRAAGNPEANPFGVEQNRRNLEIAIDCVYRQRMIPRRYSVNELFD